MKNVTLTTTCNKIPEEKNYLCNISDDSIHVLNVLCFLLCRWDNRTSVVMPEEDIFYLVAFLASAVPSSNGPDGLENILSQNKKILEYCERSHLGVKQYLPHYTTEEAWRVHFGSQWQIFQQRKSVYDPLAMLAPGQQIFQKSISFS